MTTVRVVVGFTLLLLARSACLAQDVVATQQQDLRAMELVAQAVEQINAFNNAEALQTLKEALQISPDNATAHFWIGFIARQRAAGDPEMKQLSVDHLRQALKIAPDGEFGKTVRGWLVRLTGRPPGMTLVVDSSGVSGAAGSQGYPITGDSYLMPTTLVAKRMCGEECLGFAGLLTGALVGHGGGRSQDTKKMSILGDVGYPLMMMPEDRLRKLSQEVAGGGDGSDLKCGWVVGLGRLSGLSIDSKKRLCLPLNLYAHLPLTLIDPVDGHIVSTFEVGNDILTCALGSELLSVLTKKLGLVGDLLSGGGEGALLINSLAAQSVRVLARTTGAFRERELLDEIALPLKPEGQPKALWLRALGNQGKSSVKEGATAQTSADTNEYRTPGQVLALPRLAVAPPFCADILGEEATTNLANDIVSEVVEAGDYAVLPPSEIRKGTRELRQTDPRLPLLRCYERVAEQMGARYLLLVFLDEYYSNISGRNLVASKAIVRMRGHWALRDMQQDKVVLSNRFSFQEASQKMDDGGQRLLEATEKVSAQVCRLVTASFNGFNETAGGEE